MTFLTLMVVLTQAVSVGVADEPLISASGARPMPGGRVPAVHDTGTGVYATWQMMELARRQGQSAQTRSLARRIVSDYPTEVGEEQVMTEVGFGGTPTWGARSIWFDVEAADRLLEAVADDDSQVAAEAKFLTKSASAAVEFRGYQRLIALSVKLLDTDAARSYARNALALPHYWQWEVWPPSGCTNPGGRKKHDFKDEFMTRLDGLLPLDDLKQLYKSAYYSKDTVVSRDAANWFIKHGVPEPHDGRD